MTTKKQHYIPRFYLRRFTNNNGELYAYRKDSGRRFTTRPEGVCAANYLYEVRGVGFDCEDGNPEFLRNYIENQLTGAEGRLAPLYVQLLDCCETRAFEGKPFLDGRLAVCTLAANLIVRHPVLLSADRAKASELTDAMQRNGGIAKHEQAMLNAIGIGSDLDMVSEIAIMQTLLFSDDPNVPFNRIYNALADKRMVLIEAPVGMWFVTSSMPIYFIGEDDDSYEFDVAYMPLSSKYAALFTSNQRVPQFSRASIEETIDFNVALLAQNDVWDIALAKASGTLDVTLFELAMRRA